MLSGAWTLTLENLGEDAMVDEASASAVLVGDVLCLTFRDVALETASQITLLPGSVRLEHHLELNVVGARASFGSRDNRAIARTMDRLADGYDDWLASSMPKNVLIRVTIWRTAPRVGAVR